MRIFGEVLVIFVNIVSFWFR